MTTRKQLFSVTIHDCRVDTFRAGGKGGQNQNKVESGVRVVHEPSGAVAESRDTRDQLKNKQSAFRKMARSEEFQRWARMKAWQMMSGTTVDNQVEEAMDPKNLKIEYRTANGWTTKPE